MPAIAALVVASIIFMRASACRAITTAMPSGSSVRVEVGEDALTLASKRGVSRMPYSTLRMARAGRHAMILQLRSSSVVTAIPRNLLSDAEIALIKSKI